MLRSVTAFFALVMHHLDIAALRLSIGKYTISEFAGWNIIQLRTIGAKTKKPRTLPLLALFDNKKVILIASSFGREHNPGWYYNLKANPYCHVSFKRKSGEYVAREAEGEEHERYFHRAVSQYVGYQKYKERAAHRHIPVMVLEPKT